jgi:hypothetical protein
MTTATVDKLIWVLIYGGLLVVSLGVFVKRSDEVLGWVLIVLGAIVAVAGAALVWVRSRMPEPIPQKQENP